MGLERLRTPRLFTAGLASLGAVWYGLSRHGRTRQAWRATSENGVVRCVAAVLGRRGKTSLDLVLQGRAGQAWHVATRHGDSRPDPEWSGILGGATSVPPIFIHQRS